MQRICLGKIKPAFHMRIPNKSCLRLRPDIDDVLCNSLIKLRKKERKILANLSLTNNIVALTWVGYTNRRVGWINSFWIRWNNILSVQALFSFEKWKLNMSFVKWFISTTTKRKVKKSSYLNILWLCVLGCCQCMHHHRSKLKWNMQPDHQHVQMQYMRPKIVSKGSKDKNNKLKTNSKLSQTHFDLTNKNEKGDSGFHSSSVSRMCGSGKSCYPLMDSMFDALLIVFDISMKKTAHKNECSIELRIKRIEPNKRSRLKIHSKRMNSYCSL